MHICVPYILRPHQRANIKQALGYAKICLFLLLPANITHTVMRNLWYCYNVIKLTLSQSI